jgi:hypothetical protein
VSTFLIGSSLILTYFSIGFGFVDPHWSEGRSKDEVVTTYCLFHTDTFVQVRP